jgi:hypothetical protein
MNTFLSDPLHRVPVKLYQQPNDGGSETEKYQLLRIRESQFNKDTLAEKIRTHILPIFHPNIPIQMYGRPAWWMSITVEWQPEYFG